MKRGLRAATRRMPVFISNRAQSSCLVLEHYIINEVQSHGNAAISSQNVAYALDTRSPLVYASWCRDLCERYGLLCQENAVTGLLTFEKVNWN